MAIRAPRWTSTCGSPERWTTPNARSRRYTIPGLFLEQDRIVRMGVPPFRIEIATTISGVEFESCYRTRIDALIDGVPVPVIDLASLRRNKRAAGRNKDLDDLENLPGGDAQ